MIEFGTLPSKLICTCTKIIVYLSLWKIKTFFKWAHDLLIYHSPTFTLILDKFFIIFLLPSYLFKPPNLVTMNMSFTVIDMQIVHFIWSIDPSLPLVTSMHQNFEAQYSNICETHCNSWVHFSWKVLFLS